MFRNLLSSYSISDLKPQTPITVSADETIETAFRMIKQNKILALPVIDSNSKYVGIVDNFSMLCYIINKFEKKLIFEPNSPPSPSVIDKAVLKDTLRTVLSVAPSPVTTLSRSARLTDVVRELTTAHRVIITDESGTVVRVVTQSDVIRFVVSHIDSSFPTKTLQALEISLSMNLLSTVVHVQHDTLGVEAVKHMVNNKVSAVPIVKDEEIIGHFSASDLDLSEEGSLASLFKKVSEIAPMKGIINVSPSSTIVSVLETLASKKIHRLYIVEDSKEVGLLTLTDIINIFFSS